ncbi:hypothetical protein FCOIX_13447 [Fusarium coicis]|nr:hypothetical protein FCOIX_13447 [Fusarium coicis]
MAPAISIPQSNAPPSLISFSDLPRCLIGIMAYVQDEQSSLVKSSEFLLSSSSRELLVEKLRASEARVQALEVEVSPQRPAPRSVSTQLPPQASTIAFHIEKPQHLPAKRNVNEEQSRELRKLLNRLPKTDEEWCQRRRDIQLSNPEEVTRTFLSFITRTKSQATTSEIQVDHQSLTGERILRNYRQFVDFLRQDGRTGKRDNQFIFGIFEKLYSGQFTKQSCCGGNGPSIKTYERLGQDKGAERFAWLAKLPPPLAGETNAEVPFSVPLMVKLIAGRSFSLKLINKALQTNMCQEQFDASVSSIWARTQRIRGIQFPPPKRRKISDIEACPGDGRDLFDFDKIFYPQTVCVQHGRDAFFQPVSSASVADSTGRSPYIPDTRSPENEPATNFDRCNSGMADGVRPGNPTLETPGQELWALQPSTSLYPSGGISTNGVELLIIQSSTDTLTPPWHASPPELTNDVLRPQSGQSPFTDVMRLLDEPRGSEINRDLQRDGREDEAGEESLFGGCIAGTDRLFEPEASGLSF